MFEDCVLDTARRELRRGPAPIALQPQVFDLLEYLIHHRDRVVTRDDLIVAIWGGRIVSESAIATRINAARRAIGDCGKEQRLIQTLRHKGLRFIGAVREERRAGDEIAALASLDPESTGITISILPDLSKTSIAVLPFKNLSGDPEQEYFVDGIVDEMITSLSKWRWFFVIARDSSFVYKGRAVGVKQVGRELGVRYVLEGSVRKSGDRLRLNAQLVDATSGAHVWAERFDRNPADVLAIQDDLTQCVAAAIGPAVSKVEFERAKCKTSEQLLAWDHYLRGMWHIHKFSEGGCSQALACFRRAIEMDGESADAYAGIARAYLCRVIYQFSRSREIDLRRAVEAARKALALDNENAYAWYALANGFNHVGECEIGIKHARKVIELNPSLAPGHFMFAVSSLFLGRPGEALTAVDTGLRLSPNDPQSFAWLGSRASALYLLQRYEEAIDTARQSLAIRWYHTACRVLAASYAQAGLIDQAKATIAELAKHDQAEKSIAEVLMPFKREADRRLYVEGLRKAGMPEA